MRLATSPPVHRQHRWWLAAGNLIVVFGPWLAGGCGRPPEELPPLADGYRQRATPAHAEPAAEPSPEGNDWQAPPTEGQLAGASSHAASPAVPARTAASSGDDEFGSQFEPPSQSRLDAEREHTMAQALARRELDPLIRAYHRQRRYFQDAEADYQINLAAYPLKALFLEMRDVPFPFAGELPQRDRLLFENLVQAAEQLKTALDQYMEFYAEQTDEDYAGLASLQAELETVVHMPPPGSGNRLIDALQTLDQVEQSRRSESAGTPINPGGQP